VQAADVVNHSPDDTHVLVDLAATIERDCGLGRPVVSALHDLRAALVDHAREPALAPSIAAACMRLHTVVAQLTQDVESGHVRSISGLVVQALRVVDGSTRARSTTTPG
jgi:hypothetical protein